ncbi:HD-GYP domain-containing protein (c-di-GMP phosphodiesterase class II) [Halospina denitrificans]|uniref:HD-GYP domain-containing protein (C-di-GMP phosphodiesterase class II) n=1 Tax=Halospina denitrificans TaxID=332522 RepID=A0A4R7JUV9_9GAMM|nr:HD-GYP domain-containing protein [Halospina denitrificans]TDT41656.1 HD-GYP domain-containing protein (c-di-GMP phosphodiesterase class II) [Halospina denitrificans]
MGVQRKKFLVQELEIGMFVANLDRPWHETPFPIQGFYIRNQQEIDQLIRCCRHVFVDVAEVRQKPETTAGAAKPQASGKSKEERVVKLPAVRIRNPHHYETTRTLKRELKDVEPLLDDVEQALDRLSESITRGDQRPDVEAVESVARSMVDSVARNPDALLWLSRVQSRDNYTYRHSLNLSIWALLLGRQLGLAPDVLHKLSMGAILAHVGKAKLPASLRISESHMSAGQWQEYIKYPELGAGIVEASGLPRVVANVVRYHRERHNASGFAQGVSGEEIPVLAKIVGLVDYYESMIEPRDTSGQLTPAQAVSQLFERRNSLFQEDLVDQFIQAVGVYPTGTIVELSTRELGVVISHTPKRRLWPSVLVLTDQSHTPLKNGHIVDLAKAQEEGGDLKVANCKPLGYGGIDASRYEVTGAGSRWSWRHLMSG